MEPRDPLKSQPTCSGGLLLSTSPPTEAIRQHGAGKKSHQPFRPMKPRDEAQADLTSPSSEYRHSVACLRWQKLHPPSSVLRPERQLPDRAVAMRVQAQVHMQCHLKTRSGPPRAQCHSSHVRNRPALPWPGPVVKGRRAAGRREAPPPLEKSDDFPTNNTPGHISHAMAWRPALHQPSTQSHPVVLPSGLAP